MDNKIKRKLKIGVVKQPSGDSVYSMRNMTFREKIMRWFFGDLRRVVVIVPGSDIRDITIQEVAEGGEFGEYT